MVLLWIMGSCHFLISLGVFTFFLHDSPEFYTLQKPALLSHICCKYFRGKYFLQFLFFLSLDPGSWMPQSQLAWNVPWNSWRAFQAICSQLWCSHVRNDGAHSPCLCHHMRTPLIWWADRQLGGGCARGWQRAAWQILTSRKGGDGQRRFPF